MNIWDELEEHFELIMEKISRIIEKLLFGDVL